jgi:hypothetical protein
MALLVEAGGELSYNGIAFDALYKTSMKGKPIYDDANRAVTGVEWSLEVEATIGAALAVGTTTDDTLEDLRVKLTRPGGKLRYTSKGFGEFVVNVAPVFDAAWGPKPQILEFTPIGSNQTAFIKWKVVCIIPECPDATYRKALMAANYEVSHDFDSDFYVTATTTGYIQIPLTYPLPGARTIPETVDDYRELVWFKVPIGFKRESFKWDVSADRRRGSFTIVDKEIPIPLPNGCTHCDMKHKIESSMNKAGFHVWQSEISGTIRVVPTSPRGIAMERFMLIVNSRLRPTLAMGPVSFGAIGTATGSGVSLGVGSLLPRPVVYGPGFGPVGFPVEAAVVARVTLPVIPPRLVLIDSLSITEDIFGRDNQFRLTYRIFCNLPDMLRLSGLWTPIEGTSWATYHRSVEGSVRPRGHSGIRVLAADDTIVDLCTQTKNPIYKEPSKAKALLLREPGAKAIFRRGSSSEDSPKQQGGQRQGDIATGGVDDLGGPFLDYQCAIEHDQDMHTILHKPLAGSVQERQSHPNAVGGASQIARAKIQGPKTQGSETSDIIQRRQRPTSTVILSGHAVRVDHRVPTPELLSLNGKAVVESHRWEKETSPGMIGGRVVFAKGWRIEYMVTETPASLPVPANPATRIDGVG